MGAKRYFRASKGFTLIELSIVLVIIGLIVGGVLVGQDLIRAAGERATISQIEKFNSAANTFFGKYGYLPGDIPAAPAAQFGFAPRGQYAGEGDGNGVIEGVFHNAASNNCGVMIGTGESVLFWSDLSADHLIEGSFTTAIANANALTIAQSAVPNYLPPAKLGNGNYIYVWSGGFGGQAATGQNQASDCETSGDGKNYFGIEAITGLGISGVTTGNSPGLTVQQAQRIDSKIDDGNPQSGNVRALFVNFSLGWNSPLWAAGGGTQGAYTFVSPNGYAPMTAATSGSSTTCYDNRNTLNGTPQYSIEISSGNNVNCALSFKMQAGD